MTREDGDFDKANPQLAQELNAMRACSRCGNLTSGHRESGVEYCSACGGELRGRSEPQPDYRAFGEACARILREHFARAFPSTTLIGNAVIDAARAHHIDLGSDKP